MHVPLQSFPPAADGIPNWMLDLKAHRDNIHGFIHVNEVERNVMDTPEFQRLHAIRQLGFAYLIFGTAEHSRFVHSLGVCHLAKQLVDRINGNHRLRDEKTSRRKGENLPRSWRPPICWPHRFCIGLAALLHDLPLQCHMPLNTNARSWSSMMIWSITLNCTSIFSTPKVQSANCFADIP